MAIILNDNIIKTFDIPIKKTYPTSGLISYYNMDEASGTTLYDKVSGYNATITGSYARNAGKNNTCYYNIWAIASLGDSSYHNFDHTTPFSINCWVKGTANGANRMYVTKMVDPFSPPYNGWGLYKNVDGQLAFFMGKNPATQKFELKSNGTINTSVFTNICVTYNGSNTIGGFSLYIDGVKQNTTTITNLPFSTDSTKNNGALKISAQGVSATIQYGMDELGIFNIPLTEYQVKSIYNDGKGVFLV